MCTKQLSAQNEIIVNAQVLPPYSPYISTYVDQPNKLKLTLINTSASLQKIKLWVRIAGDNGVSGTTNANYKPSMPIELAPGAVKNIDFSSQETKGYFDANNVDLVGITKTQLIQNQALPEGIYTICVKALDYTTSAPKSMDGAGCSAPFNISYIDPPLAIQPTCGVDVPKSEVQNVLFSWTPPATAPGNIQYDFQLKEVPNTMNPVDVIKNNVFPILYATTLTSQNVLVYTNALPQLQPNKKYVWRVRAKDSLGKLQFKNEGFSEPCWFVYKAPTAQTNVNTPITNITSNIPITLSSPVLAGSNAGNPFPFAPPTKAKEVDKELFSAPTATLSGKMVYKYADPGEENKEYVMKNANLVLKVGFFESQNNGTYKFVSDINAFVDSYSGDGDVIKDKFGLILTPIAATTTTDANGNYSFSFPNNYPFGEYGDVYINSLGFKAIAEGTIGKTVKTDMYSNCYVLAYVELQAPHKTLYTQPLQLFNFKNQHTQSNKKIVSLVRSEQFVAHLGPNLSTPYNQPKPPKQLATENMVGVKTYLLRKTMATSDIFPKDDAIGLPEEGDEGKTIAGMEVVASTVTDNQGKAKFKRVVHTEGYYAAYSYYIYFEFNKEDNYNYEPIQPEYIHGSGSAPKYTFTAGNDNYELSVPYSSAVKQSNNDYQYGGSLGAKFNYHIEQRNWSLKPKMPRVLGRVLDGDNNAKPIDGAFVMLQSNYNTNASARLFTGSNTTAQEQNLKNSLNSQSAATKEITYRSMNTGIAGQFKFDELPIMYDQNSMEPIGPNRGLLVIKKGYEVYENMPPSSWIGFSNKGIKVLKYGEQYVTDDIILKRQSEIKGRVTDEDGNPLAAYVHMNDDEVSEKTSYNGYFKEVYATKIVGKKQQVVIEANGFLNDTVLLEVKNAVHDIGTIKLAKRKRVLTVIVNDFETKNALNDATIEVMNVVTSCTTSTTISDGQAGQYQVNSGSIQFDATCPLSATTAFIGVAILKFENGGFDDNIVYQLRITGPKDKDFEPIYLSTKIPYSSGLGKIITVNLQPATCISGVVKNSNGEPLKGAVVKMDQTIPFISMNITVGKLQATTDDNGKYKLRNVPYRSTPQKIVVTMPGSNYVGESWEVTTKSTTPPPSNNSSSGGSVSTTNWQQGGWSTKNYTAPTNNNLPPSIANASECKVKNFVLKPFDKMDISKLLGFPIEVTAVKEVNGNVQLSGSFLNLKSNTQFSTTENSKLPFANLVVIAGASNGPSGKPLAEPVSGSVKTDATKMPIKAGFYNAQLEDNNYISVNKEVNNWGSISGSVRLSTTSMNNNDVAFDEAAYISAPYTPSAGSSLTNIYQPGIIQGGYNPNTGAFGSPSTAKKPTLKILYSDASKTTAYDAPNGFSLTNDKGKDIAISFSSFTKSAIAQSNASYWKGNEIVLSTILNTNIEGLSPANMKVAIGDIKLKDGKFQNEQKTYYTKIASKMGANWSISADKWKVDQFGLRLLSGSIATGVDVPFSDIIITPKNIRTDQATLKFDKLSLVNGKIPLAIKAENLALGYFYMEDGSTKAWQFAAFNSDGSMVSEIKGLDGLPTGQTVKLKSIFLYSNRAPSVNTLASTFNVHNIIAFTPSPKLVLNNNSFKINGTFKTDIPGTGDITASLFYDESLKVGINVSSFQFKTGNIYYVFDKAKISNKYLQADGVVFEPQVLPSLKINLDHYGANNTAIQLKSVPENIIKSAGSGGLKNLIGGNAVSKSMYAWDTLKIQGTTYGSEGMNDKKMNFEVTGAVVANNAEIGVDNIETPFGNMKWVYLMQEGTLDGSMVINQMDIGGLMLSGSLNSRIGAKGWYFKAAGQMQIPNLGGGAMYALIGNYNSTPSGDLAKGIGAFGCLPADFQGKVKGFLFQGTITRSIADVGGNFLLVEGGVKVTASLNARVYGSFAGTKTYGLGVLANVNANAFLNSPATCTSISASANAEAMVTGTYVTTTKTLTIDGCISLEVKGKLEQCAPLGPNVCPPICVGDAVSKALGINISIDSNKNFNANAFFGTCTGNACKIQ